MDQLILGTPYEVEIKTSVDIGEIEVEFCVFQTDFNYHFPMPKLKKNVYAVTIPKTLGDLSSKTVKYKIYVYKDSARFEADSDKITIVSQETVKIIKKSKDSEQKPESEEPIKVKVEVEKVEPEVTKAKPEKKPEPTPEPTKKVTESVELPRKHFIDEAKLLAALGITPLPKPAPLIAPFLSDILKNKGA